MSADGLEFPCNYYHSSLDYFDGQGEVEGGFNASQPLNFDAAPIANDDASYQFCEGVNYSYLACGISPEESSVVGKASAGGSGAAVAGDMVEFVAPSAETMTSINVAAVAWPAPGIDFFLD
jgi:hypothetical protein